MTHFTLSALHTNGIFRFSALPGCSSATTVQCAPPSFAKSDHERITAADALVRLLLVVVRRHDLGTICRTETDFSTNGSFCPLHHVWESVGSAPQRAAQTRGPLIDCPAGNSAGYAEAIMIIIMIRFRLGRWKVPFSMRT